MKTKFLVLPVLSLLLLPHQAQAQIIGNTAAGVMTGIQNNATGTLNNTTSTVTMPNSGASAGTSLNGNMGANTGVGINTGVNASTDTDVNTNTRARVNSTGSVTMPENMNAQQFSTFAASRWDTNNDGTVSDTEWNAVSPSWFGKTRVRTFSSLDVNRDGMIDSKEMQPVFSNAALYHVYDTNKDGVIDSTEAARIPQ